MLHFHTLKCQMLYFHTLKCQSEVNSVIPLFKQVDCWISALWPLDLALWPMIWHIAVDRLCGLACVAILGCFRSWNGKDSQSPHQMLILDTNQHKVMFNGSWVAVLYGYTR